MPSTTTFTSPPAWVNSTRRRSTRATQSMFSVPLSIAIRAPEETANHSSGTPSRSARPMAARMRAHSGSASEPSRLLGSPSTATRVTPSGWAGVRLRTTPDDHAGAVLAWGPVDGHQPPVAVEVVLGEVAGRQVAVAVAAAGPPVAAGEHADHLVGVDQAAPAQLRDLLAVGRQRLGGAGGP